MGGGPWPRPEGRECGVAGPLSLWDGFRGGGGDALGPGGLLGSLVGKGECRGAGVEVAAGSPGVRDMVAAPWGIGTTGEGVCGSSGDF